VIIHLSCMACSGKILQGFASRGSQPLVSDKRKRKVDSLKVVNAGSSSLNKRITYCMLYYWGRGHNPSEELYYHHQVTTTFDLEFRSGNFE
jgi:hypothetical protein